ncbi:MAG: sigma-70 family RNA polymerase sigma factor [Terriglobales bacterium]
MFCYHPAIVIGGTSQPAPARVPLAGLESLASDLFQRSGALRYGMDRAAFDATLAEIARKYVAAEAPPDETRELLQSLRVEELALARGCAAGNEQAWQEFLTRYREKLFGAAYSIARDDATARELADSLYADLYGITTRDGQRVSKLASYTGRGSLEGWLRNVLAQEYVNRYRAQRRTVSLDEKDEEGVQFAAPAREPVVALDPRLNQATDAALAAIGAEECFILASYFLDRRTLAEIARMLRVHESTISRKVEKITAALRKRIYEGLVERGMTRRQAEEALEADVRDLAVDVRARLAQETRATAFLPPEERGAGKD